MAIDPVHEKRIRNLIGSWSVRTRAGTDEQADLLRENIEALDGAMLAVERADEREIEIAEAVEILTKVRRELRRRIRLNIPVGRGEMMAFASRLGVAVEKLQ